ncbi:unnamed protein product, partial [Amoebophrya sp. A120]
RQIGLVARFFRKRFKFFANIYKMTTHQRTLRILADENNRRLLPLRVPEALAGPDASADARHDWFRVEVACRKEVLRKTLELDAKKYHDGVVVDGASTTSTSSSSQKSSPGRTTESSELSAWKAFDLDDIPLALVADVLPALLHPSCVCREVRKNKCRAAMNSDGCDQLGEILGVEPFCFLAHLYAHFKEQMRRDDELFYTEASSSTSSYKPFTVTPEDKRFLFFGKQFFLWQDDVEERRIESITESQRIAAPTELHPFVEELGTT